MIGVAGVGVRIPPFNSENLMVFAESGDTGLEDDTGVLSRKTRGRGASPERRGFMEKDLGMGRVSTLDRCSATGGKDTWDELADELEE